VRISALEDPAAGSAGLPRRSAETDDDELALLRIAARSNAERDFTLRVHGFHSLSLLNAARQNTLASLSTFHVL